MTSGCLAPPIALSSGCRGTTSTRGSNQRRPAPAGEFARALRDAGILKPIGPGKRFLTRHYCTIDREEAERLARLDGGPVVEADAAILHATGEWAFWSDGKFTTAIGLPTWAQKTRSLPDTAVTLITEARGSDSGEPKAIGGYAALARVASYTETPVSVGPSRGHYHRATVTRLDCVLVDGTSRARCTG